MCADFPSADKTLSSFLMLLRCGGILFVTINISLEEIEKFFLVVFKLFVRSL